MRGRILFVVNHAGFFLSHRLPVALAAQAAGYDVIVATPMSKHVARITDAGLHWAQIDLSRSGRNPFRELRSLYSLFRLYRRLRPDVVHHVTSKPVLYGTPLARLAGVPGVVNAISGLGHVFAAERGAAALLRNAVVLGYRFALRHPRMRVIFQNVEHHAAFVGGGWIAEDEAVLIPGSGADTELFAPVAREGRSQLVVLFASRMLYTKGVREFVEAARILRGKGVAARFVLAGEPDPDNPGTVSLEDLQRWHDEGVVEYWGRRDDMPAVFTEADVVCLPTFYPEGIPKVLIEAASCGLPIVTTDTPGCREIVRDGESGILVPPRDAGAVATALGRLIEDPVLRAEMGQKGRERVLENYSLRSVIEKTLAIYKDLID